MPLRLRSCWYISVTVHTDVLSKIPHHVFGINTNSVFHWSVICRWSVSVGKSCVSFLGSIPPDWWDIGSIRLLHISIELKCVSIEYSCGYKRCDFLRQLPWLELLSSDRQRIVRSQEAAKHVGRPVWIHLSVLKRKKTLLIVHLCAVY